MQNEQSSRLCLIRSWRVVNCEAGARRRRGESVDEEGGRDHRDRSVPLDWILRVSRVHEARDNGPGSVVKEQSARGNKGMRGGEGLYWLEPENRRPHGRHPLEASFLCNRNKHSSRQVSYSAFHKPGHSMYSRQRG